MRTITQQEQALVAGGNPLGDTVQSAGLVVIGASNTVRGIPVVGPTAAGPIYSAGAAVYQVGYCLNMPDRCAYDPMACHC
jgi:hypothetical protein